MHAKCKDKSVIRGVKRGALHLALFIAAAITTASITNKLQAFCLNEGFISAASLTCWYPDAIPDYREDHRVVILSRTSIERVSTLAIELDVALAAVFSDIKRNLNRNQADALGFVLSVEEVQQQDCKIYEATTGGKLKQGGSALIRLGYAPECRDQLLQIGYAVARFNDEEATKRDEGPPTLASAGVERILYSNHPDESWTDLFRTPYASKALQFILTHGEVPNVELISAPGFNSVSYPIKTYKIQEGDTLGGIAYRTTGSYNNWPVVWAMNHGRISGPDALVVNRDIQVPAAVHSWVEVPIPKEGSSNIPINVPRMGNTPKDLIDYVTRTCSQLAKFNKQLTCRVPVFANVDGLGKAPVAALQR